MSDPVRVPKIDYCVMDTPDSLRPGLADSDSELKAWLDAPEQSYNRFGTLEAAMKHLTAMAATDGKPRCTECKRVVHKSIREPGKNYCSWCRKYFPAA